MTPSIAMDYNPILNPLQKGMLNGVFQTFIH